jgi:hypothetical protein
MFDAPVRGIALESNRYALLNVFTYGQIEVVTDQKLLTKVRTKWITVQVADRFDKGLDGKVWAAKVTESIEFN